ncbi:MAG TPA: isocitrate lyase/PEP mutase family protein [Devosiaceae bacterium]|nr:isocitrate lyase/PEP mutase family protein [Devosiaceae bacterium]
MQAHAAALKTLLETPKLHHVAGCADGMGARLVAEAGLEIGFISGATVAALRLARPDMDLLSLPEMLDAIDMCTNAAPKVLWIADGDTGFGNEINVQRTVAACAKAGAAAVLIEDKVYPKTLGHKGGKLVVDRDAARQRCRAAAEACQKAGVLLLARTDAIHSLGRDEALARIEDFVAEGADILFLDSPKTAEDARASVQAAAGKPSVAVTIAGAKHYMPPISEVEALGYRINIHPADLVSASVYAMRQALAGLTGSPKPQIGQPAEYDIAIRRAEYLEDDARWAPRKP